jgi:hypothetical protein
MTTARADSWHENGVRAERPAMAPRRTPPPPLPPLPALGGRSAPVRPVERRAERPGDDGLRPGRPRDERLRSDLQRSRPPAARRPGDPAREPGTRRPDAGAREEGRSGSRRPPQSPRAASAPDGRLRGVVAVLGVFLATLAGGAADSFLGIGLGMITLVALVASTAVATLTVRRRDLISVVLCPPLVFVAVAGVNIALAPSATLSLPTVATLLIRGFPTMAAATAAALVLALVRLGTRR